MHRVMIWIWENARIAVKFHYFFPASRKSPCLERVTRAEVYRHEGQPDDAGRVHGEPDELGFVEVLGDLRNIFLLVPHC